MKTTAISFFLFAIFPYNAYAGCIGPVIMGECKGTETRFDTHPTPKYRPQYDAPRGFYWDKSGTRTQKDNPEWIDPFTGQDAHDSDW